MIAVSDAVLIAVSAAALSFGLYRWQGNVEQAMLGKTGGAVISQPQGDVIRPNTTQGATLNDVNAGGTSGTASTNPQLLDSQSDAQSQSQPVVVADQTPTAAINVADDAQTAADNSAVVDVPPFGSYIVQSGDTLSQIARQFGTTVSSLQQINSIEGSLINVGQELRYPQPANQ